LFLRKEPRALFRCLLNRYTNFPPSITWLVKSPIFPLQLNSYLKQRVALKQFSYFNYSCFLQILFRLVQLTVSHFFKPTHRIIKARLMSKRSYPPPKPFPSSTGRTTSTTSSRNPVSTPDSRTSEIPRHYGPSQYGSFQREANELKASFQLLKNDVSQQLAPIQQRLRVSMESQLALHQTLKTSEEPLFSLIQTLGNVIALLFNSIQELERSVKLQLTWIQMFEEVVDSLSSTIQTHKEGTRIQSDLIQVAKNTMSPLFPMIQMLKDSMASLQASIQTPSNSTKLPQVSTRDPMSLMEISQNSIQYLGRGAKEQWTSNQVLEYALALRLNSIRSYKNAMGTHFSLFSTFQFMIDLVPFQGVFDKQLELIQLLKSAVETQCPLIQALNNTAGIRVFTNATEARLCSIPSPPKV
jgi:hypothetical protein